MFYKRANSVGAFTALIASFVVSAVLYTMTKQGMIDLTFVNRIWIIFLMCLALGIAASHMTNRLLVGLARFNTFSKVSLFGLAFFMSACGVATNRLADNELGPKTIGRHVLTADGTQKAGWPGSGTEFAFARAETWDA